MKMLMETMPMRILLPLWLLEGKRGEERRGEERISG
jgi:hypothetical protein